MGKIILNEEEVARARNLYIEGKSISSIAKILKVSYSVIYKVINRVEPYRKTV